MGLNYVFLFIDDTTNLLYYKVVRVKTFEAHRDTPDAYKRLGLEHYQNWVWLGTNLIGFKASSEGLLYEKFAKRYLQ